jgi:Pectate lyase superfamily protein
MPDMKRRKFIGLLSGAIGVAWPLAAHTQQHDRAQRPAGPVGRQGPVGPQGRPGLGGTPPGWKNVLDFGLKGDGTTDNSAALRSLANMGGVIFFPPGQYVVNSAITLPNNIHILGCGAQQSIIAGGMSGGCIFVRPNIDDNGQGIVLEKVSLINDNPSPGSGCVRVSRGFMNSVRDCYLRAWRPVTMINVLGARVSNCRLVSTGAQGALIGSIGIMFDQTNNAVIDMCDFNGFYEAIRVAQNCAIRDSRIEMCQYGVVIGYDEPASVQNWYSNDYPSVFVIDNLEFEANSYHIWIHAGAGEIGNCAILGDPFSAAGNVPSQVGVMLEQPCNGLFMHTVGIGGQFQDAGVKLGPQNPAIGPVSNRLMFMGVNSVVDSLPQYPNAANWKGFGGVPAKNVTFIQCNNP